MDGSVVSIHVTPARGAPPRAVDSAEAVADAGLRGDRYFDETGAGADRDGCDLTLIEAEAVEAVAADDGITLDPGAHRRNVTTEGVALNHLVGERFRVGEAVCEGLGLCEPCSYLERQIGAKGVREAFVHRGGLECRVVESGRIRVGDAVG